MPYKRPHNDRYVQYTNRFPKDKENRVGYLEGKTRCMALNIGMALTETEEPELKLIRVNQSLYPIHMIGPCLNYFLLFFREAIEIHPGNIRRSNRPEYIGPRYSKLKAWAPIPLQKKQHIEIDSNWEYPVFDCYQLMNDLKNGNINTYYGQQEHDLARSLIGAKAVFV